MRIFAFYANVKKLIEVEFISIIGITIVPIYFLHLIAAYITCL